MISKEKRKYILISFFIMFLFVLVGCNKGEGSGCACACGTDINEPLSGFKNVLDILVWPMAGLMWVLGKSVCFANYGLVICLATIIVRTAAWPIYAKTNDMSLKTQLMGPDQAKIEARYAGKTDPESAQRKQAEMMQLYKKYGVGVGGCLMPFVQFPIFMAFYNTLQRVPNSTVAADAIIAEGGSALSFSFLNSNFLGIDLFRPMVLNGNNSTIFEVIKGGAFFEWQNLGIVLLALIVVATQIVSQIFISRRQKKMKEDQMGDIPQYRRPEPTEQQKQTEKMMKIMVYVMAVMMGWFVLSSTAALGLYWLVGNLYSTLQSYIGFKRSPKRLEKLRKANK